MLHRVVLKFAMYDKKYDIPRLDRVRNLVGKEDSFAALLAMLNRNLCGLPIKDQIDFSEILTEHAITEFNTSKFLGGGGGGGGVAQELGVTLIG